MDTNTTLGSETSQPDSKSQLPPDEDRESVMDALAMEVARVQRQTTSINAEVYARTLLKQHAMFWMLPKTN